MHDPRFHLWLDTFATTGCRLSRSRAISRARALALALA